MAKYYVTCGSYRFLTSARSPLAAVLWGIHQFLSRRVDLETMDWTDPSTIDRADLIQAMLELDDTIAVSESGFGRDDAGVIDTAEALNEWNALLAAIDRLQAAMGCE